jgi:hypothetical protein
LTDGVEISKMIIADKEKDIKKSVHIMGTNMPVPIMALLPGKTVHCTLNYSYTLNKTSHIRTGQVDEARFLWPTFSRG